MNNLDLATTSINLSYEINKDDRFLDEYYHLSDKDSVSKHIKNPKMLSEATDGELIIIELLSEIFHRLDRLEDRLLQKPSVYLELENSVTISAITHDAFMISEPVLEIEKEYYGRFELPVYPKTTIGLFFIAQDKNLAKITRIHNEDSADYSSYVMSLVRAKIRKIKGLD